MKKYLLPIFFASGFTGLTYEVIWQKQLVLILGASAPAVTAVLTAFFLGIAFGGKLGDRLLLKYTNPLKLYAGAEAGVAVWALLLPALFSLFSGLYASVGVSLNEYTAFLFRFGGSTLLLLPATLAMGATIPLMSACLAGKNENGVRYAYGINALGAAAGALASGFVLVVLLGVQNALRAAILLNIIAASAAWLLSARLQARAVGGGEEVAGRRLLWAYFLSGFAALGAEIVWLRVIGIYTTSGSLMFAVTLFFYLAGFSAGSLLLHPRLAEKFSAEREIPAVCLLTAFFILFSVPLIRLSPWVAGFLLRDTAGGLFPYKILLAECYPPFAAVFLPSLFMGAVFPAMSRLTRKVGNLYFAGNLGSAAGAFAFGLIFIPLAGLTGSLALLSLLALAAFFSAPVKKTSLHKAAAGFTAALALGYALLALPFVKGEVKLVKSGDVLLELAQGQLAGRILRYKEGASSTVAVREDPVSSERTIYVDEQPVAATDLVNAVDSKMLAHIPLLLHPAPGAALTVGYGSGGTSWSMTRYPVEVSAVEIEPEVVNSSYLFEYKAVLSNPRFRLYLNDARDLLGAGRGRYDAISTDATNLQFKQNPSLYTVDYFRLMKARLAPGGIACAWVPMAITPEDLKTLVASFREVFPHAAFWYMHHLHTTFGILTGTEERLEIDYSGVAARMGMDAVAEDLARIWVNDPAEVASFVLLDEDGVRSYSGGAALHTDDRPVLEYTLPYYAYQSVEMFYANLSELMKHSPGKPQDLVKNYPAAKSKSLANSLAAAVYWREAIVEENKGLEAKTPEERREHLIAALAKAQKAFAVAPTFVGQLRIVEISEMLGRQSSVPSPAFPPGLAEWPTKRTVQEAGK